MESQLGLTLIPPVGQAPHCNVTSQQQSAKAFHPNQAQTTDIAVINKLTHKLVQTALKLVSEVGLFYTLAKDQWHERVSLMKQLRPIRTGRNNPYSPTCKQISQKANIRTQKDNYIISRLICNVGAQVQIHFWAIWHI